jgi:predicted RND superfamily exporter protein
MTTTQPTLPFVAPKPFTKGTKLWKVARVLIKNGMTATTLQFEDDYLGASYRQRIDDIREVLGGKDTITVVTKVVDGERHSTWTVIETCRDTLAQLAEE